MAATLRSDLSEVLHAPARTIRSTATLRELATELAEDHIGLLVVEGRGGDLVGVVSERDLTVAVANDEDLDSTRVVDIMTTEVVTVSVATTIGDAAAKMAEADVRHLVVLDHGTAFGVVSSRDVTAVAGVSD
jgi:signal-transduction protein with cAMP-binding, CBS, and nucleotidyltransferase domain